MPRGRSFPNFLGWADMKILGGRPGEVGCRTASPDSGIQTDRVDRNFGDSAGAAHESAGSTGVRNQRQLGKIERFRFQAAF